MKVCILGRAPSWKAAPFNDNNIEIWTLNNYMYKVAPRIDKYFDVHIPHMNYRLDDEYRAWLLANQEKLYICDKSELLPEANIIDWRKLVYKYGAYFTSSVSWMIAQAMEYESLTDLYIYGIDFLEAKEYMIQRPCVEYLLGIAKGKGINIYTQVTSMIFKSDRLYGVER